MIYPCLQSSYTLTLITQLVINQMFIVAWLSCYKTVSLLCLGRGYSDQGQILIILPSTLRLSFHCLRSFNAVCSNCYSCVPAEGKGQLLSPSEMRVGLDCQALYYDFSIGASRERAGEDAQRAKLYCIQTDMYVNLTLTEDCEQCNLSTHITQCGD